jgi:HAD superfamily 5'-nucleotidase-like hydrolase
MTDEVQPAAPAADSPPPPAHPSLAAEAAAIAAGFAPPPPHRRLFCNRTLNLRAIRAVGYDMDYTLIHYRVERWELRAYEDLRRRLAAEGFPVEELAFDRDLVMRGLVVDTELGNVVKANRFGFVKAAAHGTRPLTFDEQRASYSRRIVDLAEERWVFLNTFFSLSEACMYSQLVDLLDAGRLPAHLGYRDLWARVHALLDATHTEGELKAEIGADPDAYVLLDPETPLALLDQRHAGKKLLLVTNSEWSYTQRIMSWAFDRFLPPGTTWRDLFHVVIAGARKPDFFLGRMPLFEIVGGEGLLQPARTLREGGAFFGGDARTVERCLGLSGDEILYVGDHIYGDVRVSKEVQRWRTALVLRELEGEIAAALEFAPEQARLDGLMAEKERLERQRCEARLRLQRRRAGYGPPIERSVAELEREVAALRERVTALDGTIAPIAAAAAALGNPRWGLLLQAGNDKSHLAKQLERWADIYTSRVSNLGLRTPFVYLRSRRGTLPHDPLSGGD